MPADGPCQRAARPGQQVDRGGGIEVEHAGRRLHVPLIADHSIARIRGLVRAVMIDPRSALGCASVIGCASG